MNSRVHHEKTTALTLVEVLVVVVAIGVLAILAVMLLPSRNPPHQNASQRMNCINNLKQIGIAYRIWAGDNGDKYPMEVSVANGGTMELAADGKDLWLNFLVMSNDLNTPKILICPADTGRVAATDFTTRFSAKNISYFVGLDAGTNYPQAFLSGDDNFEIGGTRIKSGLLNISTNAPVAWTAARHVNVGNIGLADGGVARVDNSGLTNLLHQTGVTTNRLAIP